MVNSYDLMERCNAFCEKVNWEHESLVIFSRNIGLSVEEIIQYAKSFYVTDTDSLLNIQNKILASGSINVNIFYRLFFDLAMATSEEEAFNIIDQSPVNILYEVTHKYIETSIREFSLKRLVRLNNMEREAVIFKINNYINRYINNEKCEDIKVLLEKCYDCCMGALFDYIIMKRFADRLGITVAAVVANAKTYTVEYLGKTEQEFDTLKDMCCESSKMYDLILIQIVDETDDRKIALCINNSGIKNFEALYKYVSTFVANRSIDTGNKSKMIFDLMDKIRRYINTSSKEKSNVVFLNEGQKQEKITKKAEVEALNSANEMINFFLRSGLTTVGKFCCAYGIKIVDFNFNLKLVKKYNLELYEECRGRIDGTNIVTVSDVHEIVASIAQAIEQSSEIVANNIKIKFDLIDYYTMTDLNIEALKEFKGYSREISEKQMALLKKFIKLNTSEEIYDLSERRIEGIMETYDEVGVKFDSRGNPIKGTGKVITKEEKEQILEFLRTNNIPLNTRTYRLAYRRYVSGRLDFKKSFSKKRSIAKN